MDNICRPDDDFLEDLMLLTNDYDSRHPKVGGDHNFDYDDDEEPIYVNYGRGRRNYQAILDSSLSESFSSLAVGGHKVHSPPVNEQIQRQKTKGRGQLAQNGPMVSQSTIDIRHQCLVAFGSGPREVIVTSVSACSPSEQFADNFLQSPEKLKDFGISSYGDSESKERLTVLSPSPAVGHPRPGLPQHSENRFLVHSDHLPSQANNKDLTPRVASSNSDMGAFAPLNNEFKSSRLVQNDGHNERRSSSGSDGSDSFVMIKKDTSEPPIQFPSGTLGTPAGYEELADEDIYYSDSEDETNFPIPESHKWHQVSRPTRTKPSLNTQNSATNNAEAKPILRKPSQFLYSHPNATPNPPRNTPCPPNFKPNFSKGKPFSQRSNANYKRSNSFSKRDSPSPVKCASDPGDKIIQKCVSKYLSSEKINDQQRGGLSFDQIRKEELGCGSHETNLPNYPLADLREGPGSRGSGSEHVPKHDPATATKRNVERPLYTPFGAPLKGPDTWHHDKDFPTLCSASQPVAKPTQLPDATAQTNGYSCTGAKPKIRPQSLSPQASQDAFATTASRRGTTPYVLLIENLPNTITIGSIYDFLEPFGTIGEIALEPLTAGAAQTATVYVEDEETCEYIISCLDQSQVPLEGSDCEEVLRVTRIE